MRPKSCSELRDGTGSKVSQLLMLRNIQRYSAMTISRGGAACIFSGVPGSVLKAATMPSPYFFGAGVAWMVQKSTPAAKTGRDGIDA
jgi:hypothetical protein